MQVRGLRLASRSPSPPRCSSPGQRVPSRQVEVIPGHGELALHAGVEALYHTLNDTLELVRGALAAGQSAQEVEAANLLAKYAG